MWTLSVGIVLIAGLVVQRENKTANRILAIVMSCALYRHFALEWAITDVENRDWILRSTFPFTLLAPSLFYIYVQAMTSSSFHLGRKYLVHLLPVCFGLAWFLIFSILHLIYPWENYVRLIILNIVKIPYIAVILTQVWAFEERMTNVTSVPTRTLMSWLTFLVVSGLIISSVDLADVVTGPDLQLWHFIPKVMSVITLVLGFFTIRYSSVFAKDLALQALEMGPNGNGSRLSLEELAVYSRQVTEFFNKEMPYLNPMLRLSDLANSLSFKPYILSDVIKNGLHTNFYTLVNSYRVEKAKTLLYDPKYAHLNLFGIALESGFNSKSVFNEVFKKITQMTPSEYREATTNRETKTASTDSAMLYRSPLAPDSRPQQIQK